MGRSITTARGSVEVLYFRLPDEDEIREGWADYFRVEDPDFTPEMVDQSTIDQERGWLEDLLYEQVGSALDKYPSMSTVDAWLDREIHVVADNRLASVGISWLDDLFAVSIFPTGEHTDHALPLSVPWTRRMGRHIAASIRSSVTLEELRKTGTFSDGTSVYEVVAPAATAPASTTTTTPR